jgi:hypothetical protein
MTNIVKSVNIQYNAYAQDLLSFAVGKSPREAMQHAEKATREHYNLAETVGFEPRRRAPQYGEMSWCLYRGNKVLAWVDMNR